MLSAAVVSAPLPRRAVSRQADPRRGSVPGGLVDRHGHARAGGIGFAVDRPAAVVENKAGADGAIAAAEVAKAAPDGYTLLMATNSPMSAVPALKKSPPYDPVADFTPITDVGRYTFFIVVHPSVPAKTLAELIDYARANPGQAQLRHRQHHRHRLDRLFASLAKIQMVHVPYKGEPQAVTDLVAGRVQLMFCSSSTSMPQIREGKLRALVTTLGKRSHLLPEVPTIAEAGMPQFSITSWAGLFGPAKMPREVVERLNKEFVAAMGAPRCAGGDGEAGLRAQPVVARASWRPSSRSRWRATAASCAPPASSRTRPGKLRSQVSWRLASWRVAAIACSRMVSRSIAPSRYSQAWR